MWCSPTHWLSPHDMPCAVIAAYADGPGFATAKKVRMGRLGHAAKSGAQLVIPMSYQSIIALAQSLADDPTLWSDLAAWVERKIAFVAAGHVETGIIG